MHHAATGSKAQGTANTGTRLAPTKLQDMMQKPSRRRGPQRQHNMQASRACMGTRALSKMKGSSTIHARQLAYNTRQHSQRHLGTCGNNRNT